MTTYALQVRTPQGVRILHVPRNSRQSLADILRREGMPLNVRCGQRGVCEGCMVELERGSVQHVHRDEIVATAEPVEIRACDYRPCADLALQVEQRSLLSYEPHVVDGYAIRISHAKDPLSDRPLGIAVDIGTTTVAVMLVDLATGKVLARGTAFNAQMHFGDDVVTRISLCMQASDNVRRLQTAIVESTLTPLIDDVVARAGRRGEDVGAITVAGNTTMLHLFTGVDPTSMGVAPFTPKFVEHRASPATPLLGNGRVSVRHAVVHLLPSAAAYVGADIVAGLIATGMAYEEETTLLVDIGTNGEIVLKRDGKLIGCATAAGPAFEGARLASGMRAGQGAITAVRLGTGSHPPHIQWIGEEQSGSPVGMCGSAYIDFLAEGKRVGLLSEMGRFVREAAGESRWTDNERTIAYRLTNGRDKRPIVVTDCDVASLLSAKAAVSAGITLLLEHAGISARDVERVYLAGGFGTHMNTENAIAIGLLPGFQREQIVAVGNTSLAGAYLALLDQSLLGDMKRISREVEVLELNGVARFQDAYIDALLLP